MARPTTKADLMEAANSNFESLKEFIASMTEQELATPFDFSKDEKKKEAHWQRDKNLRDILIHLYEWHSLTLEWVRANQKGDAKPFLPKPYNWKTYGQMNVFFWKKHQNTSLEEAKEMLEKSHQEIMQLAEGFSNDELFAKGVFDWVGGSALVSYFVSNTSRHYEW
ncbi:MAG: ClbS/DfsB family four-helix bundle protein, partial [Lachnospiraceae bacterium]|nr:ClbS/DfsB family four-helix bundle protein [Lachnospiraceae bacterium]